MSSNGTERIDRRHVDQHVEPPERLAPRRARAADTRRLRQVRLDQDDTRARPSRIAAAASSASRARSVVRQRDVHPAAREIDGDGGANPFAAGDQRDAVRVTDVPCSVRRIISQSDLDGARDQADAAQPIRPAASVCRWPKKLDHGDFARIRRSAVLMLNTIGIEPGTDFVPIERHRYRRARPPSHGKRRHDRLPGRVAHDVEIHRRAAFGFARFDRDELRMFARHLRGNRRPRRRAPCPARRRAAAGRKRAGHDRRMSSRTVRGRDPRAWPAAAAPHARPLTKNCRTGSRSKASQSGLSSSSTRLFMTCIAMQPRLTSVSSVLRVPPTNVVDVASDRGGAES